MYVGMFCVLKALHLLTLLDIQSGPSFCSLELALRPKADLKGAYSYLERSKSSPSVQYTLLENQSKFPGYNVKCRGKPDTT